MTVPGKGGRPRKWRTDADRVRAFRARQQGVAEPPALRQALDDGDELARAMEQVRQLRVELREARRSLAQVGRELAAAKREIETERRRFGWLQMTNDELARKRDDVSAGREAPLPRAERRRLERQQRRKPNS